MAARGSGDSEGYTLQRGVDDVFMRMPLWPWSAIGLIVLGGIGGARLSGWLRLVAPLPESALHWAACAGYGIVAAAVLLTIPRFIHLVSLRGALGRRPANDGGDTPWWPLRLLAAALHLAPAGARTQQDFIVAVGRAGSYARSLLAYRLWPACVAAFIAPVLGLLSAWETGWQIVSKAGVNSPDVLMQFTAQVSPPMVITISAGLALMVVLAVIDQMTKSILLRWGSTMCLADAETVACQRLIRGYASSRPRAVQDDRRPASKPTGAGSGRLAAVAKAQAPADDLQRLLDEFPGGR